MKKGRILITLLGAVLCFCLLPVTADATSVGMSDINADGAYYILGGSIRQEDGALSPFLVTDDTIKENARNNAGLSFEDADTLAVLFQDKYYKNGKRVNVPVQLSQKVLDALSGNDQALFVGWPTSSVTIPSDKIPGGGTSGLQVTIPQGDDELTVQITGSNVSGVVVNTTFSTTGSSQDILSGGFTLNVNLDSTGSANIPADPNPPQRPEDDGFITLEELLTELQNMVYLDNQGNFINPFAEAAKKYQEGRSQRELDKELTPSEFAEIATKIVHSCISQSTAKRFTLDIMGNSSAAKCMENLTTYCHQVLSLEVGAPYLSNNTANSLRQYAPALLPPVDTPSDYARINQFLIDNIDMDNAANAANPPQTQALATSNSTVTEEEEEEEEDDSFLDGGNLPTDKDENGEPIVPDDSGLTDAGAGSGK